MNVDDLKVYFDISTDSALAEQLNVSASTISKWRHNNIPEQMQELFYYRSKGELISDYPIIDKSNIDESEE